MIRVHLGERGLSKLLSLVVAGTYVFSLAWAGEGHGTASMLTFLVIPLAMIWFSQAMGDFTGGTRVGMPRITKATPGGAVHLLGWLLLLYPPVSGLIVHLANS